MSIVLSILFLILKIIGILLLTLLALILIVLLVPIGYQFEGGAHKDEKPQGEVKVTWLFFVLCFRLRYLDEHLNYEFKIFGKTLKSNASDPVHENEQKPDEIKPEIKPDAETKEEEPEEVVIQVENQEEPKEEETKEETLKETHEEETPAVTEKKTVEYNPTRRPTDFGDTKQQEKKNKKKDEKKKDDKKEEMDQGPSRFEAITSKINQLKQKIDQGKELMDEYQVFFLLDLMKKTLIKVIRHIFPKCLSGYLHYGFEDPSATGKLTAVFAMFYPVYRNSFRVDPEFNEVCFEGDVKGRGRLYIGFFLWLVITLLLKKEVRKVIRLLLK